MEQKTFLAIVLSFLFLLGYNVLVIEPQQKNKQKSSQVLGNSTVTSVIPASNRPIPLASAVSQVTLPKDNKEVALTGKSFNLDILSGSGQINALTAKTYKYSPFLGAFADLLPVAQFESYSEEGGLVQLFYVEDNLKITKTVKEIDENTLKIQIDYRNTSDLSILKNVQINLFNIDIHRVKHDQDKMRDNILFEYSVFTDNKVVRKSNAYKFSNKENKSEPKSIEWAGWRDRYHFVIVKPEFKVQAYAVNAIDEYDLSISVSAGETKIDPGTTQTFELTVYVGPQDLQLLKNLDGNLNKIMAFSGFGFLDFIEKFIYHTLLFMYKFIPNWGLCIILISVLIYGATYPLTLKSMLSMRKMQELQPKMVELREKHKNNPQKLNAEVVELYKTNNVNPLSGCLPILLQMPVFISLYQVLWRTHNFQEAKFLWINDLSAPDKLFIMPYALPFLGNEFNILPFLMAIVMFFQQKLSAKNMVITDPAQEMQQKMMMFVMPIFIGGIFYHFASGLTLYFTVFYLLSTLTQYKMSKMNKVK